MRRLGNPGSIPPSSPWKPVSLTMLEDIWRTPTLIAKPSFRLPCLYSIAKKVTAESSTR